MLSKKDGGLASKFRKFKHLSRTGLGLICHPNLKNMIPKKILIYIFFENMKPLVKEKIPRIYSVRLWFLSVDCYIVLE